MHNLNFGGGFAKESRRTSRRVEKNVDGVDDDLLGWMAVKEGMKRREECVRDVRYMMMWV